VIPIRKVTIGITHTLLLTLELHGGIAMPKTSSTAHVEFKAVNAGAAAIDIGSKMHMAAVDPACTDTPIRAFGTFTQDLHDLANWFKACGVTSVAMESTGFTGSRLTRFSSNTASRSFWSTRVTPRTCLGAKPMSAMPHGYASFILMACYAEAFALMPRSPHCVPTCVTESGWAAHIQHMQKALMEMNLQLHHVVSDITGATGMRIIQAIVSGERDPEVLASHRDVRCHASTETIRAALLGNYRDEHIFALIQSLELYDAYQAKMLECDRKLEASIAALTDKGIKPAGKLPKPRVKTKQVNTPSFDVRAALYGVLGIDLTEIHGLGPSLR
jgi:transposase